MCLWNLFPVRSHGAVSCHREREATNLNVTAARSSGRQTPEPEEDKGEETGAAWMKTAMPRLDGRQSRRGGCPRLKRGTEVLGVGNTARGRVGRA